MMDYALTNMVRGGWAAECHRPDCWWWDVFEDEDEAYFKLHQHMWRSHRIEVTRRKAISR
jgi:hypothetical protein